MHALALIATLALPAVPALAGPMPPWDPAKRSSAMEAVLVEAEAFAQPGGWVVDPQFMDQMGSPYLLAHGLGRPVANAVTEAEFPSAGVYHVWVRTLDWVAPWGASGAPGRFQVLVEGRPLEATFGTEGAAWHWQDGGTIEITRPRVRLALHDLTGFEGRCDAILFVRDGRFAPPNRDPEMAAFRRLCLGLAETPDPGGAFDLVVVGGGIAGTCAAVSAARLGLTVALVQDRPVLGGNNSSEVRVWLQGARNKEPWPRIGDVVAELEQQRQAHYGPANTAELYEDGKKLALVRAEPSLRLFLDRRANGVERDGDRIRAVIAQHIATGRRLRIEGRWFADCTGDAAVGALAGADFEVEPTGHMGPCNLWNVIETDTPQPFPRCPWALDLAERPFPGRDRSRPDPGKLGGWYWESGFDRDPMAEMERVRDWNFRAMYGAWDALRNVDGVLPNYRLNWSAHILGKRESRRLLGDVVLCFDDLAGDRQFPDGCVPTGWSNDLHHPDPRYEKGFEGNAFIAVAHFGQFPAHREQRPFWIPYRCLYSRNLANLFMAGRDISTRHNALGAVRVMRTGGCMGEVVGMAASLCKEHDTTPRAVYQDHLGELQDLMRRGTGKAPATEFPLPRSAAGAPPVIPTPTWLDQAGPNLARRANVSSATGSKPGSPPSRITDGRIEVTDNAGRWLGTGALPHSVELSWDGPVTLGAARIVSGYFAGTVTAPIADFALQWHDGAQWRDVPGAVVTGNRDPYWNATFPAVTTARLRLRISATHIQVTRLWEIELYGPIAKGSERGEAAKEHGG
ncbi:MAG: FAD-dependent oxidoreductase [Lentisphaeria bacterium]|nr:FAD-dependent oxidoreductase [Lentisphaeria bacterium]